MKINTISNVSFGYKSILKTHWLNGSLPNVTKGFYGGDLTKDTITLEHLKPVSKGGKTELKNLVLSEDIRNWNRGNKPLTEVFNKEAFQTYCEEFKGVKLPYFNGDDYIKQITKTIERLLKQ